MDCFSTSRPLWSSSPSTLITFYEDTGSDMRGRYLSDILNWGTRSLENSHDYIQTLFPLPERSGINDRAPIIDQYVFKTFRARPELRERLRDAFKKMLWFYGFELIHEHGNPVVKKGSHYQAHAAHWRTRFDHNHLRITRIIRCLRTLGLEDEALAFYNTISSDSVVSPTSKKFWERAAHRPLNIRPDIEYADDRDETIGPKFLWEFEQRRKEDHVEEGREIAENKDESLQDGNTHQDQANRTN